MLAQETVKHSYTELPDTRLAQLTLAGDQDAFACLVLRYQASVFSFVRHFLGDYDLASDVTQQVFVRLYTSLSTLRTGQPLKPWLFQVARYSCIDELRRQHRQAIPFSTLEPDYKKDEECNFSLDDIPDGHPSLEEEQEQRDLQYLLQKAIIALPPRFRAVVALRYLGQLKFAEIGRILHMPEPTAKTYFARARLLLRKSLGSYKELTLT
jgi:RNA polymerase sigma-70 factor (ECF subfamily)